MAAINANINSSVGWIPLSEADALALSPGFYTIDTENIDVGGLHFTGTRTTTTPNGRWVTRGFAGSTAASHTSGATLTRYYPEAPGGEGGAEVPDPAGHDDGDVLTIVSEEYALGPLAKDFYAQDADPGSVGAGSVWKDTTQQVSGGYAWYQRNLANDGWESIVNPVAVGTGAAGAFANSYAQAVNATAEAINSAQTSGSGDARANATATASGDGGADASLAATSDGAGAATTWSLASALGAGTASTISYASAISGDVDGTSTAETGTGAALNGIKAIRGASESSLVVAVSGAGVASIIALGLPSADPEIAGQLYTDGVVSAGVPQALMVSGGPA